MRLRRRHTQPTFAALRMWLALLAVGALTVLAAHWHPVLADGGAVVTSVVAADQLVVRIGDDEQTVQLAGVASVAAGDPLFPASRRAVLELCGGQGVEISVTLSTAGDEIAWVTLADSRSLNVEVVTSGFAWWVDEVDTATGSSRLRRLQAAETEARRTERGLWRRDGWSPPYRIRSGPEVPRLSVPPPGPSRSGCTPRASCCRVCSKGKACGNSCISRRFNCHQPPGCACDAVDVCPGGG